MRITVRDLTGVIPGASVSVVRPGTPATPVAQAATNAEGVAVVENLPAGTYDVRITFTGFADASRTAVVVRPASKSRTNRRWAIDIGVSSAG